MPDTNVNDPYSAYGGSVAPPVAPATASASHPGNEDPYAAYGGAVAATAASVAPVPPPAQADPYAAYGGRAVSVPPEQNDPYVAYGGKSTAPATTESTPSILTRLKNVVEGPGTFFGTSELGDAWSNLFRHPINYAENAFGYAKDLIGKPVLSITNAETPEFQKARPVVAGVSDFAQSLTSPGNIMVAGIVGPVLKGATLGAKALGLGPKAAALIPKLVSLGFGASQISQAAADFPEIHDALQRGDRNEAERLLTHAVLSGALGLAAGYHGAKGTLDVAKSVLTHPEDVVAGSPELAKKFPKIAKELSKPTVSAALDQNDYSHAVHELQFENQITAAQAHDVELEGKKLIPDEKRQEALTNFHEAGGNADLLAQREAATREGAGRVIPTESVPPAEQGTQIFHGTTANISTIHDLDAAYSKAKSVAGPGIYITTDPEVASGYVRDQQNSRILTGLLSPVAKLIDASKPLPGDVLKSEGLPKGTSYFDALRDIRDKMSLEDSVPEIEKLQRAVAAAGYHGVTNLYPGVRDASMIFPDYVLAENQKFHDLVQAKLPRTAAPLVAPSQGEEVPFGEANKPSPRGLLKQNLALKPVTAEEKVAENQRRNDLATGYQLAQNLTPAEKNFQFRVANMLEDRKHELQKAELLPSGQVRLNYIHHDWQNIPDEEAPNSTSPREFSGSPKDFLKRRVFDTFHEGEQNGGIPTSKNFTALNSDYLRNSGNVLAEKHLVANLEAGRLNDGTPLVARGGFMADNGMVIAEHPQDIRVTNEQIKTLTKEGRLADLIRAGKIYARPDETGQPSYFFKLSNYVRTPLRTVQMVPMPVSEAFKNQLGITDKPELLPSDEARAANEQRIKKLESQQVLYKGSDGKLYEAARRPVRVPLYAAPEIGTHLNNILEDYTPDTKTFFGKIAKGYLSVNREMKQALLSLSPFHMATETGRNMEAQGFIKGFKGSVKAVLFPEPIDYSNLTPAQSDAIRNGLVVSEVRPRSTDLTSEGLGAGESSSLVNKVIDKVAKTVSDGLKKVGVPDKIADRINTNFNKVFTDKVFGPHGMITQQKFSFYDAYKPKIAELIRKQHPEWKASRIDTVAGRTAARFANDQYGGLNYTILGRSMRSQSMARALLLAPDFLESTGRSVLDLVDPYGSPLLQKIIEYNISKWLLARATNYALHHRKDDDLEESVEATHPEAGFNFLSPDGKTLYTYRDKTSDFIHAVSDPRGFILNRISPFLKASDVAIEGRDEYGRVIPPAQRVGALVKSSLPITLQAPAAAIAPSILGNTGVAEPNPIGTSLHSFGIQNFANQTPAEKLAMQIASGHLEGQPIRSGKDLISHQLGLRAEDALRTAYASKDPQQIKNAQDNLASLRSQKIISVKQYGQYLKAARKTRLEGVFDRLSPEDTLRVWSVAVPSEKRQLAPLMQRKYVAWREKVVQNGGNLNALSADDQQIMNGFRSASTEAAALRQQPIGPPNTNLPDPGYYREVEKLAGRLLDAVRAHL